MRLCHTCGAENEEAAFRCRICDTVLQFQPPSSDAGDRPAAGPPPNQLGPSIALFGAGLLFIATVVPFNEFFKLVSFAGPGLTVLGRMVSYWVPILALGWASFQYLRPSPPPVLVRGLALGLAVAVAATFFGQLVQSSGYGGRVGLGAAFGLLGSALAVIGTVAPVMERGVRRARSL